MYGSVDGDQGMARTSTKSTDDNNGTSTGGSRTGGAYERVTINLTERASAALAGAVAVTADSKTDTLNKAILTYELLVRIQAAGGAFYLRERDGAELERIRLL